MSLIAIVNYGMGNLGSIQNMLKKIGVASVITSSPDDILNATKLILPGVGAFDAGMARLNESGLVPTLNEKVLTQKTPVLGICLGMQMMTSGSTEGVIPGLGWVDAHTKRFDQLAMPDLKVPHMGWNVAAPVKQSPLLEDFPEDARFYFVHSFYVTCDRPADSLLKTRYGAVDMDAGFHHENVMGVQFHPEKSHRFGMWLLKNFAERC
jgi:glutamine amidotransferase